MIHTDFKSLFDLSKSDAEKLLIETTNHLTNIDYNAVISTDNKRGLIIGYGVGNQRPNINTSDTHNILIQYFLLKNIIKK